MNIKEKRLRLQELKTQIENKKKEKDYFKAMQLALKLVINGTYGAFANRYFVCSNADIANAITAHGRDVIQFMLKEIEDYFYNRWHLDKTIHDKLGVEYIVEIDGKYASVSKDYKILGWKHDTIEDLFKHRNIDKEKLEKYEYEHDGMNVLFNYNIHEFDEVLPLDPNPTWEDLEGNPKYQGNNQLVIYGDTDSVDYQTIINTNNGKYTIEKLYEKNIINGSAGNTLKGHESVLCTDKILNYNDKELYYANVKRIIRHKVTKEKWKLKTKSGKEILVTNDHSMIVFRNNKKIEIKPKDILKSDKILIIIKK
jgi:DNA polymerase elongation subunit (family B)